MVLITVDEARKYFAHPSQHGEGFTEADLPDWGLYYAKDGVCLMFHAAPFRGTWMVHIGVLLTAWGRTTEPARALIREFLADVQPDHLMAWIDEKNRAAVALARRVGFVPEGRTANGIEMLGWRR